MNAHLAFLEDLRIPRVVQIAGLQLEEAGDDLHVVLHPVMNLAEQHNLFLERSLDAAARSWCRSVMFLICATKCTGAPSVSRTSVTARRIQTIWPALWR